MNAIELIERDHRRIRRLLRDLATGPRQDRSEVFELLEETLQRHSAVEEDIFYPAVRAAADSDWGDEVYIKSRDEHKLVDTVLPHMRFIHRQSEAFTAKARLTRELVENHIENENRELLPLALEVLSPQRLDDLGARMRTSSLALKGHPILAAQSRAFDCDRDGFRIAGPFFTIISGIGC
jgi:hemerythrin-like domain-containing protein